VDEAGFEHEVLERSWRRPVVVDFTSASCAPCRALAPLIAEAAAARADVVDLVEVDVDESPALARRYWIWGLPAVRGFRDGRVVARFTGGRERRRVERFFDQLANR
jgi:putative thioredoxin